VEPVTVNPFVILAEPDTCSLFIVSSTGAVVLPDCSARFPVVPNHFPTIWVPVELYTVRSVVSKAILFVQVVLVCKFLLNQPSRNLVAFTPIS